MKIFPKSQDPGMWTRLKKWAGGHSPTGVGQTLRQMIPGNKLALQLAGKHAPFLIQQAKDRNAMPPHLGESLRQIVTRVLIEEGLGSELAKNVRSLRKRPGSEAAKEFFRRFSEKVAQKTSEGRQGLRSMLQKQSDFRRGRFREGLGLMALGAAAADSVGRSLGRAVLNIKKERPRGWFEPKPAPSRLDAINAATERWTGFKLHDPEAWHRPLLGVPQDAAKRTVGGMWKATKHVAKAHLNRLWQGGVR